MRTSTRSSACGAWFTCSWARLGAAWLPRGPGRGAARHPGRGDVPVARRDADTRVGRRAFSYERIVQPAGTRTASHATTRATPKRAGPPRRPQRRAGPHELPDLITRGLVHYLDCGWNSGGCEKLSPLSFGTLKSPLWSVLNAGHQEVALSRDEMARVKTWIDSTARSGRTTSSARAGRWGQPPSHARPPRRGRAGLRLGGTGSRCGAGARASTKHPRAHGHWEPSGRELPIGDMATQ